MLVSDGLFNDADADADASDAEPGRGPRVLDLYAGSGALAFEALSRGASAAVLVEHARDAVAVIRQNARDLGAEKRILLLDAKVDRALPRVEGAFGIVFLDPPYAEVKTPGFASAIAAAAALLAPGGVLVLEHASADDPPDIAALAPDRSRRHGDTMLSLYRPKST